jgi:hypothetical protein
MKEVSAVPRLPVPEVEPGLDGSVDELEDKFVPAEEDELPQGVLDLLATLTVRHGPRAGTASGTAQASIHSSQTEVVERPALLTRVEGGTVHQRPVPNRLEPAVSALEPVAMSTLRSTSTSTSTSISTSKLKSEAPLPLIEPPSRPIDPSSPSSERIIPSDDVEFPDVLPIAPDNRHAPSVARTFSASAPAMPPAPPLEITVEEVVSPSRDFLQVPFNKGAASGQVTITRTPGESVSNLVLSPSNAQVFEHLREPFEQVRDSHWRLADTADEQPHHGSHQSSDDEQEEQEERPA